jgi:hypothetical protein
LKQAECGWKAPESLAMLRRAEFGGVDGWQRIEEEAWL